MGLVMAMGACVVVASKNFLKFYKNRKNNNNKKQGQNRNVNKEIKYLLSSGGKKREINTFKQSAKKIR